MSTRGSSNHRVPVVVGLIAFLVAGLFGVTASAPAAVQAAPGDVGQAGPSFAGSGADPTGTKPESKVWYNDGFWWASMYNASASAYTIHRLSGTTWTNTGVVIDDREATHSDILWDQSAGKLYVASHIYDLSPQQGTGLEARLYRFSYNSGNDTYTLDGGFPQTITTWTSETLVIDKDSTGQLWATWTRGSSVRVNRTTSGDQTWGTEFIPAVNNTGVAADDISTIVAFGGDKIGLLWSKQNGSPNTTDAFHFSIHLDTAGDTTWGAETPIFAGTDQADDHLNIKADAAGNLYAIVKTSLDNAGSGAANLVALKRTASSGTWSATVFSTQAQQFTRGIVDIDTTNNLMRVFATAPTSNGTIYEKTSPLSSLSFASGLGTAFIKDNANQSVNNATTTKQTVNSTTGLLVLAGHETLNQYWFNVDTLGGGPPPTPTPTPTPGGATITLNPAADAQVKSTAATTNYGTLSSFRTRKDAGTADTYQSYLTFNVAGVTGTVNSVKLRLFTSDESPNVQSVFSGDPTSWTEGGLNWNNRPTFTTLRGSAAVPTLAAYNEITLDPALITGNVPISLMITSANSNSAIFNSREAGSNLPQLVITQTVGNQVPTASPVSKSTAHDVAATVNLAGGDLETCNLVFAPGATAPAHGGIGTITNPAGCTGSGPFSDTATVVYTPTAGYSGPDSFSYTVSDGTNPPVSATVTMTVTNATPTATGSSQTTAEDTPKSIGLAGADADDCDLTFVVGTLPANGSLGPIADVACSGTGPFADTATIGYTPDSGYNGPDSFTYTVSDGVTTSAPATVTITVGTPPNAPPTASPVSKSTPHDVAATVNLAGTDTETCELTFATGTAPTHGTLGSIGNATCTAGSPNSDTATILYTPDPAYDGPDSFTYTVSDGINAPVTGTVSITVTNAGPTATGSSQATTQGAPVTFNLAGADADDCDLDFNAPATTSKGTLSATGALACTGGSPNTDRASITYTPNAGQTGADSFTFTVGDGTTTSAAATVNITIAASGGTPTTFTPMADASVKSDSVNSNYGTDARLRTRAAAVDTPTIWRPYVRFNVTGTGTVTGVKLRLWVDTATPDGGAVYKTTDGAWTDTSLTWTTAQALTLGPVLGQVGATTGKAGTWVEVDLGAAAVTANGTYTYAIQSASSSSGYFSSKEGTHAPELVVTRAP